MSSNITGFLVIEIFSIYQNACQICDMESDNTGSLDAPELMISQGFRLLKSVASGKINWVEITL